MKRRDVFEYCLHQLLDRYKEKALRELEISKRDPDEVDTDWTLEEVCAADFTRAMERIGVLSFEEKESEGAR